MEKFEFGWGVVMNNGDSIIVSEFLLTDLLSFVLIGLMS